MGIETRWAKEADLADMIEIDEHCFVPKWGKNGFLDFDASPVNIILVATLGDEVAGFCGYSLIPNAIHIERIGVHPDFSRIGVGSRMIAKLVGKLARARRHTITALAYDGSLGAHLFFRSCGFIATEVRELEGRTYYNFQYTVKERGANRLARYL